MFAGGTLGAQTERLGRAVGQLGSDIPTAPPCLVCRVVKPLPTRLLAERWVEVEGTLALMAIE